MTSTGAARAATARSATLMATASVGEAVEEEGELVAAEAGDQVAGPHRFLEAGRHDAAGARRRRRGRGCR